MIVEISLDRLSEILESANDRGSVLLTRLVSNASTFLPRNLCTLYEVKNKNKTLGLMCLYSGNLTAHFWKKADLNELMSFLSFEGSAAKFLEADEKIVRKLSKNCAKEAVFGSEFVLKKATNSFNSDCEIFENGDARDFFNSLKSANPAYQNTPFESYYCDYFYRKDPPARLFNAALKGRKVGAAAVLHFYKQNAIISDVSVHPDFRRLGIGGHLVSEVCKKLKSEGYAPCLLCTSPSAAKLYKKIGFKTQSRFGLLLLKDDER